MINTVKQTLRLLNQYTSMKRFLKHYCHYCSKRISSQIISFVDQLPNYFSLIDKSSKIPMLFNRKILSQINEHINIRRTKSDRNGLIFINSMSFILTFIIIVIKYSII